MSKYREIERKYIVPAGTRYKTVENSILDAYIKEMLTPPGDILFAETIDDYWEVPGKGDFVRLRNSWGHRLNGDRSVLKEVTVKHKDRGSNLNRLEINVEVDRVQDTRALLNVVLGAPIGKIRKYETVVFAPDGCVVSLCAVREGETYVEVEGPTVQSLKKHEELLKLSALKQEPKNLFELYVKRSPEAPERSDSA